MKKKIIISSTLAVLSLGLGVLGFFILPEQVVIQFSLGSSGNATAPKLLAIIIPTVLGIGGAVMSLFVKDHEKASGKGLLLSVIGIGLAIFMIAVNSFA